MGILDGEALKTAGYKQVEVPEFRGFNAVVWLFSSELFD
jgi:hypothetical protein